MNSFRFSDAYLFFKFIEDVHYGATKKHEGRPLSWADLASSSSPTEDFIEPKWSNSTLDGSSDIPDHIYTPLWPLDEHNIKLLDNVHPPQWIEPVFDGTYNVIVIGAGSGGLVTSSGAAGLGAKVALIEANSLGGDCLNVGCVPSKSLIQAANLAHTVKDRNSLEESGISLEGSVTVDFAKTMKRLRRIRADISESDSATRYTRNLAVDVYFGYAKFASQSTIEVNGKTLKFRKAVIATGGHASIPAIPGLKELYQKSSAAAEHFPKPAVMTNETFFNLTALPTRLCVIGTGVVGMELGQAMQRLGSSVMMFGRSGKVLSNEDADLSGIVKEQMINDGVSFQLAVSKYICINVTGNVSNEGYEEIYMKTEENGETKEYFFDAVLICTGRRPNVANLNLEAAGIMYNLKDGLKVNDMLQTSNTNVYGVGDCCSPYKFTHAADAMARIVIRNALFLGRAKMSNILIPYATYTYPEIAHVGLYEADMKVKNIRYRTFEKKFADNDRAICDGATQGLVRIHIEEKSDVIIGASIVGAGAGNMISEVTLAMQSKTGLLALSSVIHPYPTTGEAIRHVGLLYNKSRLTLTVKKVLRGIVRMQG